MRNMIITEIDSHCYLIETKEFHDDNIVYHWSSTPGYFTAENKKTYKRHYFDWKTFSDFGSAVAHIWKIEVMRKDGRLLALPGLDY